MYIHWQMRELNLKIVYYGPAESGKTTNLEKIHARIDPKRCSQMISLKTNNDRTIYFDFFQLELGKIGPFIPKLHLYTVPGQPCYEASRKLVLKGVDGVVFVADSDSARLAENIESWHNLESHLESYGMSIKSLPVLVQFNKQDLANAYQPELLHNLLNLNGFHSVPASAINEEGVINTLKRITHDVILHVQQKMS